MRHVEYGVLVTSDTHTWLDTVHLTLQGAEEAAAKLLSEGHDFTGRVEIVTVVERHVEVVLGEWASAS